jgi:hypothetical protein
VRVKTAPIALEMCVMGSVVCFILRSARLHLCSMVPGQDQGRRWVLA